MVKICQLVNKKLDKVKSHNNIAIRKLIEPNLGVYAAVSAAHHVSAHRVILNGHTCKYLQTCVTGILFSVSASVVV